MAATVVLAVLGALLALMVGAMLLGSARWQSITSDLRQRLNDGRVERPERFVDLGAVAAYPEPVRRYLNRVLTQGSRIPLSVRLSHRGTINLSEDGEQWMLFTSDQLVILQRPGFDWNARVPIVPGVSVRVHDAYVRGEGYLEASLLGLLEVAHQQDESGPFAQGELIRFLAESAWYPHLLLPGNGVEWEAVDAHSARAMLSDGNVVVRLTFRFDQDGLLSVVEADSRGRTSGTEMIPTPWEGRFSRYARRGDALVPLDAEVAWLLPQGRKPYWRGHIETLEYE